MKLLTHVLPIKRHKHLKSEACTDTQAEWQEVRVRDEYEYGI